MIRVTLKLTAAGVILLPRVVLRIRCYNGGCPPAWLVLGFVILNLSLLAVAALFALLLVLLKFEVIYLLTAALFCVYALDLDVLKHEFQVHRESVLGNLVALGARSTG